MRFEWDDNKNAANILKHGIDFIDVAGAFEDLMLVRPDRRRDYGEDRFIGLGAMPRPSGPPMIVVLIFTPLGARIRIISARKAKRREIQDYYQAFYFAP